MIDEENIIYIRDEVTTLESLAKILELNYQNDSEIDPSDLWALVLVIRENLNKLTKYMNNLSYTEENTPNKHIA